MLIYDEDGPVAETLDPFDRDPPAEVPSLDGFRHTDKRPGLAPEMSEAELIARIEGRYPRDHSPEAVAARKALLERDPLLAAPVEPTTYLPPATGRRKPVPAHVQAAADRAEESARLNKARRRW